MRALKIAVRIFVFAFLTVLTQIGGLVYFLSLTICYYSDGWVKNKFQKLTYRTGVFLFLYFLATLVLVPAITPSLGRVPLPLKETHHLRPLTAWTVLLNRNYVRKELRDAAWSVADKMSAGYPGVVLNYLDAGFPFVNGFPLFPHLSHDDGKKLDLSFCYRDVKSGQTTNDSPSPIGYGIGEEPLPGEANTAAGCAQKGYWQYSFLTKLIPQKNKMNFRLDANRTRELVNRFAQEEAIGKIFIEPHLKSRLNLASDKIRFHGCQAVRHDDHIHVQLR